METTFPYRDLAFQSAFSYAMGSTLFIIGSAWAFQPEAFPDHHYHAGLNNPGVPLTTLLGCVFFQTGAGIARLEAINQGYLHGSTMQRLVDIHQDQAKRLSDDTTHHILARLYPVNRRRDADAEYANIVDESLNLETQSPRSRDLHGRERGIYYIEQPNRASSSTSAPRRWRWWPTCHDLRTHLIHDIGFLACCIQEFGVTVYTFSSIALFAAVWTALGSSGQLFAYWIPQTLASLCFIVASMMFTLETQEKWWKPQANVLGWWIGITALLGSIGFM